jgi:hypothetical protein
LTIIGLIGILAGVTLLITAPVTAGTRGGSEKKRWQPLRGEKDILLLRNQPRHVIEGTGAAGMLLGETETELRQRYGAPAYRDNAAPETLHYTEETFNATYVMRNGRIVEIRLEVAKHKSPSLEWFTALGTIFAEVLRHAAATAGGRYGGCLCARHPVSFPGKNRNICRRHAAGTVRRGLIPDCAPGSRK